ncbi:DUF7657 domain-containing protein [Acetobacterium malicum]|uniref:Glycosyltransferase RgtA/B/C/D-like domain-containing protein n=1 Tax=Acetobacterium malicum TaxID=52692 RepID=A0ABR6YXK9_9FIRM|nr:hypothetical protein [Acetobacterium malicum]MBC3899933.1 hypothetical protein [Acetobacterium malicum]
MEKLTGIVYKYRFWISGILLILLVFFEIHGSSILYWQNYLSNLTYIYKPLIGISRGIRSDEWAVNTPMLLSQYYNNSGLFPYFSETIRGTLTDTFIIYGQPVRDVAIFFRPFHWGYLLLSPAKGLSFFWISRVIALFLVSFEFGMILTQKSKLLSLIYALLITWSPVVQWWFAINGLVEMLVFGQLALIMITLYMNNQNYYKRSLYALVVLICAGGYILTFYPAWQVPLAYVFLVLFIGVVLENRKHFHWNKKDVGIGLGLILFLSIGMIYILAKSGGTISSVMNTVYPGGSAETGGNQFSRLFLYPGNLFFAFSRELTYANFCELAVYFDFFPMGIILTGWVLFKQKKADIFLILMLLANTALILWCLFSWPEWLAKATLLSYSKPVRAFLAVGFLNILLLIKALVLFEGGFSKWIKVGAALLMSVVITLLSRELYEGYLDLKMSILILFLLFGSFYVILSGNKDWARKVLLVISLAIVFVAGLFVNPVVSGLDAVYQQNLIKKIQQINSADNGLWIVDSGAEIGFPIINLPLMAGAPTINSTNVYPILERWHLLDPDGSEEDIYNRYAHISMNLTNTNSETNFVLKSPDLFEVNLNIADLEKLEVSYVFSKRDLSTLSNEEVSLIELADENGFKIYTVNYN